MNPSDWTQERILADMEAMIRREGQRQYCAALHLELGVYLSQLCGVSAHLVRKTGMNRLFTHDLDITIKEGEVIFTKGSPMLLRAHHRSLFAYRKAISSTPMPAMDTYLNNNAEAA